MHRLGSRSLSRGRADRGTPHGLGLLALDGAGSAAAIVLADRAAARRKTLRCERNDAVSLSEPPLEVGARCQGGREAEVQLQGHDSEAGRFQATAEVLESPEKNVFALSDLELVRRIVSGDAVAFTEAYRRHQRVAASIAFRVLHDRALSEDAVQEAFLGLWRDAAKFDPARARLSTWVAVLAHRRAVDITRREARRQTDEFDERLAPADSYTLEERIVLREDQRRVRAVVSDLPERQRTVVALAYYGGLTLVEIATRLDIPLGTAKSRMFNALATLNELLAEPRVEAAAA